MNKILIMMLLAVCTLQCATVERSWRAKGMTTPAGSPLAYQASTTYAIHLFCGWRPLVGDASVDGAMQNFVSDARQAGALKYEVSNVDQNSLCDSVFGITIIPLIFSPTITTIYGPIYSR